MKKESTVQLAIDLLKSIDIDGETMQHVIESVGMQDQMLRQLVLSAGAGKVNELLTEKTDIDNSNFEIKDMSDDTILTILDHHYSTSREGITLNVSSEYEDIEWGIRLDDKSIQSLIDRLQLHLKARSINKVEVSI